MVRDPVSCAAPAQVPRYLSPAPISVGDGFTEWPIVS